MANFTGTPAPINRFLGFLDSDDPTNTPMGLASVARNCMFDLTSVRTRDGFQTSMQAKDNSPITMLLGINYLPETASQSFVQVPILSQLTGRLQYESPVGSGRMNDFPAGQLFSPPANSHSIAIQTYNRAWLTWTDLNVPLSQMCVIDPINKYVDPYGMKPFGWTWLAGQPVLVGEMATPTSPGGNGHTYRCTTAGTTGTSEPIWPLTENGTVADGSVTWEEYTLVLANRLPPPGQPVLTRDPSAGAFAAGRDVYIVITFTNGMGESLPSVSGLLSNTNLDDAVQVALPAIATLAGWIKGLTSPYAVTGYQVYEADVTHGSPAPPQTSYQQVTGGPYSPGTTVTVTATASSGVYPPTQCTARITPGQLPTPTDEPDTQRISSGGTFPAGRDVYVLATYVNGNGETPAGPPSSIIDTELDDGIGVTVAAPADYPQILTINIYEADVPTGTPAPPSTAFALVGGYAPGATPTITASASGPPPPIVNGTGPAGNIVADQPNGGINGTQGYRYAGVCFFNRIFSTSGFTPASVVKYDVDEDGWEIAAFNVATGPANIIARKVFFTVADGTAAGPFYWIGNYNPQQPSANFIYPQTLLSDNIEISATIFADNVTTFGTFNFTDEYLQASNSVTDRLDIIWPAPCVHVAYHPSLDRMMQTGVYGTMGGCYVSLAGAPEDYYADLCQVSIENYDGQRAWGTIEYRQVSYLMMERSGYAITANPNNPQSWIARRRWDQTGPCGPRAFDACDKFMMWVHHSGIYRYESDSDTMTKEIPNWWSQVNFSPTAARTISLKIDYQTHQIQVLLPINGSNIPNRKLMLDFKEGWANPIHFSTYSGREISMDACRKYSDDDMSAYVCTRLYRNLGAPPIPGEGDTPDDLPLTPASFYISQFAYGSSGPDGTVQVSQPGVFNDNGAGIDWQYETVCPQQAMALSQAEGFVLNARGAGKLFAWMLGMRASKYGQQQGAPPKPPVIPIKRPIDLDIEMGEGISRMVTPVLSEKWRVRFTNGKVKNAWASLKWLQIYTVPLFSGRTESEKGG